ncbi:LLM class flavin-dependent oxidoreductase [Staphylococcus devriesei]|uniref:LLM class flavin-dependent oxidoreductase n=1 Tax=Staphylococcus devriesei TaxID=586733 RepID=UPI000E6A7FC2|nr:LLM class flavin-dependent oxidoreductase [Staphylococcus devriesei]RIL75498.1 LLM class flavin-dependent oxidoreductase [Staphylococcus devriesei]
MKLSLLDYVPIFEGRSAQEAFNHSVELAQTAEQLGYERYWVAEHHHVPSVASSASEMVMMMLLEQTSSIRIGSGGVMLPHYSAYKVAEQFKIMEARHPHRVDMAIGRSPSFKNVNEALNEFKTHQPDLTQQIDDLNKYFADDTQEPHRFMSLTATPFIESAPLMYILGMSDRSAELAAQKGLPFVVARMGQAPAQLNKVIQHYRHRFEDYHPSNATQQPYVIIAAFVVTADHEEMIDNLMDALHLWLMRINYLKQPPSYPSIETAQQRTYSQRELEKIAKDKKRIISGLPDEVAQQLSDLQNDYDVDEIMILPHVFGEENRLNLIKLVANAIH